MRTHLGFQIFFIPFYLLFLFGVSATCQIDQQSILIRLKNELHFNSWLYAGDCCKWAGVTCSIGGQVIGLDLSDEAISGGINDSSALFGLKNLQMLNLAVNYLNFTRIPSAIGSLTTLRNLNLSNSEFSGQIPGELAQLTKLEILDLSSPFSLGIPSLKLEKPNLDMLVGNLTRLKGLYLDYVNISASKSDWCQALSSSLLHLEVLSLSGCQLSGPLDDSLGKLHSLSVIHLAQNNLSASVPDFFGDFRNLTVLNLGNCSLYGTFPTKVLQLQKLQSLVLSDNMNLYGSLPDLPVNESLRSLVIINTNLSGAMPISIGNLKRLSWIELQRSNFSGQIPKSMESLTKLLYLDLSSNNFTGQIPSFELCKNLTHIDLSRNSLSGTTPSAHFQDLFKLEYLDLHSNLLSGVIPVPPEHALFIDYSNNLFNSSLPQSISLHFVSSFSVSNNLLTGKIPETICNTLTLQVLDLSNNQLTGRIPRCLIEHDRSDLGVLNLGNNSLSGRIEGIFPFFCRLNTLDLHGNLLEGEIPRSLADCNMLQVLNLGNNKMNDTYPCFLGNNTDLSVLVLRSNNFHGPVGCGQDRPSNWSKIQILDIAHNNFTGTVAEDLFEHWDAMMTAYDREPYLNFQKTYYSIYYQNSVTVTMKGHDYKLVKILTIFTSIDMSSNHFSGNIPSTIGRLKALYLLNVSHNEFTGSIPPSIGNLSQLESLDMSSNKLNGEIPPVLSSLSFLSVLNLSYNRLKGRIPTGSQFQTFTQTSYKGNKGLCGFPLNISCSSSDVVVPSAPKSQESKDGDDWQSLFHGMAAGSGFIGVLAIVYTLCRRSTSGTSRQ